MSRTRTELTALQERNGWEKNPKLTMADCRRMTIAEYEWREVFDAENLARALNEKSEQRRVEDEGIGAKAKQLFSGKASAEELAPFVAEQNEWRSEHPQFPLAQPALNTNLIAVARELDEQGLLPSRRNIERIFQKLAIEGKLILDASAFGGPAQLTGTTLQKFIRQCPEILDGMKPASDAQTLAKMSANEYKQKSMSESPADWKDIEGSGEAPALIYQRIEKFVATAKSFRPAFVATEKSRDQILGWIKSQGRSGTQLNDFLDAIDALTADGTLKSSAAIVTAGATTKTNFASSTPDAGYPQPDVSNSLRRKLERLNSHEYRDFLKNNPSVKAALDRE